MSLDQLMSKLKSMKRVSDKLEEQKERE